MTLHRHLHPTLPGTRRMLLTLLVSAAAAAALGCADRAELEVQVQPVPASRGGDRDESGAAPSEAAPPARAAEPAPTDRTDQGSSDRMDTVTDVLSRYSSALDQLVADPASVEPTSPALAAWHAVVVPGGPLDRDVLSGVRRRLQQEQVVIGPGPEGYAYRHRPVEVLESSVDRVRFRWCVHAPGVARTIADGVIVDDEVGHATGTGRAVRETSGRWVLDALEQEELRVLPTGRPDPCP